MTTSLRGNEVAVQMTEWLCCDFPSPDEPQNPDEIFVTMLSADTELGNE